MTEKEKMKAGYLYDGNYEPNLAKERNQAKSLCYAHNQLNPIQIKQRQKMIRSIVAKTGDQFCIEQPFYCDYGYNVEFGKAFYANHNLVLLDPAKITFGDNVFIGPNCGFYTAGHPIDAEQRNEGLEIALPITVGNSVWFGGGVSVLPGITIGSNVVIGAGSVVTKDIPDGVIAAGNPCVVIREITEADKNKYPIFESGC